MESTAARCIALTFLTVGICPSLGAVESTPLAFYPSVRFLTPDSAAVTWESTQAGPSVLAYGATKQLGSLVHSGGKGQRHQVILADLPAGKVCYYRLGIMLDGKRELSPIFEFDNSMNYMPPQLSAGDSWSPTLTEKIKTLGGYAIVNCAEVGPWSRRLAAHSNLTVIAVAENERQLNQLRTDWYRNNEYGIRLSAQTWDQLPDRFANLAVGNFELLGQAKAKLAPGAVYLCLDPPSPTADFQWQSVDDQWWWGQRIMSEPITGWGHQYGSPANASFVGESLGGVDDTANLKVQWLGRPGADFGIDRNPRMPAPLAIGGRLFHQGMNRMIALDAYSGAVLWSLEIPGLRRVNIPRDCANWCADQHHVFAAVKDRLWKIDAATGQTVHTYQLPEPYQPTHHWGFVADGGDVLLATAMKPDGGYESFWDKAAWYDGKDDATTAKVCGDALVVYDKAYGNILWQRKLDAAVHSTITMHQDRIYYVEVEDDRLAELTESKLTNEQIWPNASVVCLDLKSGDRIWKQPVPWQQAQVIVSFGVADETQFVLQTSSANQFHFYSFDGNSGTERWRRSVDWPEDNHGGHMQHAVLMDGRIYVQPHVLDAGDGRVLKTGTLGKRRGCATPIGAGGSIIYRGGSGPLTLWSLEKDQPSEFVRLRPSCWLSTIPAQGMLFSPEGGGGCSCGGWMETSIGFVPSVGPEEVAR